MYLEYIPKMCSTITSHPMCSSLTLRFWFSCHWEVRSLFPPSQSGTMLLTLWLLRLGHKRLYSFCLVHLGHSEPPYKSAATWIGYVDMPHIDVLANSQRSQPVRASPAKHVNEEDSKHEVTPSLLSCPSWVPRHHGAETSCLCSDLPEFLTHRIYEHNKMAVLSH